MARLEYQSPQPSLHLPHHAGLVGWGIALILLGVIALIASSASLYGGTIALFNAGLPRYTVKPEPLLWAGVLYLCLSLSFLKIGIGSCRARRWVRPVMIACCLLALFNALMTVFPTILALIQQITMPPPSFGGRPFPMPPGWREKGIMNLSREIAYLTVLGFGPSGMMLWFYGRRSLQQALDVADPNPNWTDRLTLPQVVWCILPFALGLDFFNCCIRGFTPLFKDVVDGQANSQLDLMIIGVLFAAAALSVWRFSLGWLLGIMALLFLAGSFLLFWVDGDHARYVSDASALLPADNPYGGIRPSDTAIPAVTYLSAVIFAIWVGWSGRRTNRMAIDPPEVDPIIEDFRR